MEPTATAGDAAPEPQRERVLRLLREHEAGLTLAQLAGELGVHPNTVRWHLARLADEGLVRSEPEHRAGPGRPAARYVLGDGHPAAGESYRFIAGLLAGALSASEDGLAAAERAGAAWGRYLVERPSPLSPPTRDEAVARLAALLAEHGFDPVVRDGAIAMRRCPFADLIASEGQVICRAHLGILRGAADELGAGVGVTALEVYPEPGICRVRLDLGP